MAIASIEIPRILAAAISGTKSSGPVETVIAGIVCLAIGAVGVWAGLGGLRARAALRMWPSVRGRVIERGATGYMRHRYEAFVRYAYEVGGQEFFSDRIYPKRMGPRWFTTRDDAQRRANAFAENTVEAHYNPSDPAEAYLALRSARQMRWMVGIAAVPLAAGVLLLLWVAARFL